VSPAGIVGASNGFNILAGLNGLEAGMGIIILSALGGLAWVTESVPAAVIAFCMVASLLSFFWFNKYPARILPGNGLTYAVGTTIAIVAIVGNIERSALILFVPYFIELLLKLRGLFQKESLARPLSDGSLTNKYSKWYSLNHVVISLLRKVKGKAREWEVVLVLLSFELIFVVVAFALAKF
jgi:UDP-N-acetylglucosamine--dolichyl-phosphate N-acetylglucosaminephosphotransferase